MLTEPIAANARSAPAARTLFFLDIPQVLNLGCHQWRNNSTVHAAVRNDFGSYFLFHISAGAQLWFQTLLWLNSYWGELSVLSQDSRVGLGTHWQISYLQSLQPSLTVGQVLAPSDRFCSSESYLHPPGH